LAVNAQAPSRGRKEIEMKNYILNLETQRIELHFEKSEYQALTDAQKSELKGAFLWSKYATAWVSKSTKDHYWAKQIAAKLGFEGEEKTGERLSFAEEMERKVEKAEHRAERMEIHAENAEKRAVSLQSEFNKYRQDWSWLTQPIISGHAGSQRFGRQRAAVMARYDKGFEEYRKSDYFKERAEIARGTASMAQMGNAVYLDNRIKECQKDIKQVEQRIIECEELLYKVEQGEELKNYKGAIITAEKVQNGLKEWMEKLEYYMDKQAYFENAMDALRAAGRKIYTKDEIQVGYIVKMQRWGRCEIVSAGPVNVIFKILDGGASGGCLTEAYAAIVEILEAKKAPKAVENPFNVGDILCKERPADGSIYMSYQVVKVTDTGIKIRRIATENGKPIADKFTGEPVQKKVTKSKYSNFVGVYEDDWQLHKYQPKAEAQEAI
jgi:hypothetical protein